MENILEGNKDTVKKVNKQRNLRVDLAIYDPKYIFLHKSLH